MEKAALNKALYRPILNGKDYDNYFSKSSCKSVYLGTGNTHLTISEMKKWAKKYVNHITKIAPLLIGNSLRETTNNIHQFLYHHVQYKIDEYHQNLKSPACAWATRKDGTDCKSYSIFASTILLNLGIKHYLRKVRQKGLNPQYWTHVYVTIPIDQKNADLKQGYYVIDATLKSNKEVSYIAKKDVKMDVTLPNYGLASPEKPGCMCNSYAPQYKGQQALSLGAVAHKEIFNDATMGFETFLSTLSKYSSSNYAVQQLRGLIYSRLNSGFDPQIKITDSGIYVDGRFVNLKNTFRNLRAAKINALGFTSGTGVEEDLAKNLISSLLPDDFFESTFGAVFANGFDLSCWNSAHNETEAQQQISNYKYPYLAYFLSNAQNTNNIQEMQANINALIKYAYILKEDSMLYLKGNNWVKCSRKGIQKQIDFFNEFIQSIEGLVQALKGNYNLTMSTTESAVTISMPKSITGHTKDISLTKFKNRKVSHPAYTLTPKPNSSTGTKNSLTDNFTNVGDMPINNNGSSVETKKTGSTMMGTGVFAALLIGAIAFGAKKFK